MNVVITGASRGIGKAIAEKFASQGHQLFLSARNKDTLQGTVDELKKKYPAIKIKQMTADLSSKKDVDALGEWLLDQQMDYDVLVNNAGNFLPGSVHNEPEGTLENMMAVNLYSAYHLTRLMLPQLMRNKKGHIFNMCSIASLKAYANGGSYSISKFALLGFTKNLREEMKPYNVKVTAVIPGAAFTDSWARSGINADRLMEAKDIAELVYSASQLSARACVEEITVRPQLGDI